MRVIVVGAGITGVAVAVNLRRLGSTVTLVDKVFPGSLEQASFGNAGLLARSGIVPLSTPGLLKKIPRMISDAESPLFIKLTHIPKLIPWFIPFLKSASKSKLKAIIPALDSLTNDTVEQHQMLAHGTGAEEFIKQGNFAFLYKSEACYEDDDFSRKVKSDFGYKCKKITLPEIKIMDENISASYNVGCVFNNHGWITDPGLYLKTIFNSYKQDGGIFVKSEVTDIFDNGVKFKGGKTIIADKIVLATGAWSNRFRLNLGFKPRIEGERGYHVFFKGANRVPPFPIMVTDGKFIITPMKGGIRCAGVIEFNRLDAPPSSEPIKLIMKKIKEIYEDLEFEEAITWMGHRPSTPDSLPLIGSVTDHPNIICAFGGQHVGLTIGPKVGLLVADLIHKKLNNFNLSPFRPDRFE